MAQMGTLPSQLSVDCFGLCLTGDGVRAGTERRKERQEEIKEQQKAQRRNVLAAKRSTDLAQMVRDAERRQARFDAKEEEMATTSTSNTNQRTFLKELKKVRPAVKVAQISGADICPWYDGGDR